MLDNDDPIGFDQLLSASPRQGPTTEQLDAMLLAAQMRLQQAAQRRQDPNP